MNNIIKKEIKHKIKYVSPGSIAEEMEIEAGDFLLKIGEEALEDIFDYQYMIQDSYLEILIEKKDGEQWLLEIDKDPDEDLGIIFDNGLMDEYRSCKNKCIFCFIDQMPPGMRDTLYFKDDDSRLSFLQGNYVTLTNMSDHDVERICKYHLSPINISIHTMNPDLRCKMLNNRFAGKSLKILDVLNEHDITMNGQIVLCPGVNDGAELEYSILRMMEYAPNLQSVSIVPVGVTKYREGLFPLTTFDKKGSGEVIDLIEKYQKICYDKFGFHFLHASDEWYIVAEREVPQEEVYDGYCQLENGVGMVRLMLNDFHQCMNNLGNLSVHPGRVTLATGRLIAPIIKQMAEEFMTQFPQRDIQVIPIRNDFFGEKITVSGLITGCDLINQLKDLDLGERLVIPQNMLKSTEAVFLDDVRLEEVIHTLQVPVSIVKSDGLDMIHMFAGLYY